MFIMSWSRKDKVELSVSFWLTPPRWLSPKQAIRLTSQSVDWKLQRRTIDLLRLITRLTDTRKGLVRRKSLMYFPQIKDTQTITTTQTVCWKHNNELCYVSLSHSQATQAVYGNHSSLSQQSLLAIFLIPNKPSLWATGSNRQKGENLLYEY